VVEGIHREGSTTG